MNYCKPLYFLVFLPVVLIVYNCLPKKFRPFILLLASYVFFYLISGKLLAYLLFSTLVIYGLGLWLEHVKKSKDKELECCEKDHKKEVKEKYKKKSKRILLIGVLINLGILLFVKYTPFFASNLNALLNKLNTDIMISIPKILMPIGISFYTLQAISYLMDIYHEKIIADKNLLNVALFMSFFPQIMEGPIVRYTDTMPALVSGDRSNYKSITFGFQRILWGLFKKIIIADRLNLFIKTVFNSYEIYNGGIILLAAIFYTIQLYMEFSGTMDVVIGSAEIFNVKLPENFRQPFFSKNISEFWSRWHITLGTWFKDYIFYPVSLSKGLKKITLKMRKILGNHFGPLIAGSIALLLVWFCNGLWHGAGWNYIFFGIYHFMLILSGNLFEPLGQKVCMKLKINRESKKYKALIIFKTTILVIIGELFFRAISLTAGIEMFKKIIFDFSLTEIIDGTVLKLGLDIKDIIIVLVALLVVLVVSIFKEKKVNIREKVASQNIFIRWGLYYALIFAIIIFGAYGMGYAPVDPIYAGF